MHNSIRTGGGGQQQVGVSDSMQQAWPAGAFCGGEAEPTNITTVNRARLLTIGCTIFSSTTVVGINVDGGQE